MKFEPIVVTVFDDQFHIIIIDILKAIINHWVQEMILREFFYRIFTRHSQIGRKRYLIINR